MNEPNWNAVSEVSGFAPRTRAAEPERIDGGQDRRRALRSVRGNAAAQLVGPVQNDLDVSRGRFAQVQDFILDEPLAVS